MNIVFLASPSLNIQLGDYVPLMIVCGVLAVLFVVFKLTGVRSKVLWTLLINGMIGAAMLSLFSIVFYSYLNMKFFKVPIDWIPSLISGVLGVPGVLLLLILKSLQFLE